MKTAPNPKLNRQHDIGKRANEYGKPGKARQAAGTTFSHSESTKPPNHDAHLSNLSSHTLSEPRQQLQNTAPMVHRPAWQHTSGKIRHCPSPANNYRTPHPWYIARHGKIPAAANFDIAQAPQTATEHRTHGTSPGIAKCQREPSPISASTSLNTLQQQSIPCHIYCPQHQRNRATPIIRCSASTETWQRTPIQLRPA